MAVAILNFLHMMCLDCDGDLISIDNKNLICEKCSRIYPFIEPGYFNFTSREPSKWNIHWKEIGYLDKYMVSNEVEYFNELSSEVFKGNIVLDVGCGTGKNMEKYLSERPKILIMIDVSDSLLIAINKWHMIKEKYRDVEVIFVKCDIHKLPFKSDQKLQIVYTTCGVLNMFKDQDICINEAMRFSQWIFILFNSPKNVFGKIYYSLNCIRSVMKIIFPNEDLRNFFAKITSYVGYFFIKILINLFSKEVGTFFRREVLEFIIHDWLFTSPNGIAYNERYYNEIGKEKFESRIVEKVISRIIFYKRKNNRDYLLQYN